VPEDDKKAIEEKLAELKKVKDGTDADAIKKANEELSKVSMKIGEALQKAAQQEAQQTEKKVEENPHNENAKEGEEQK
jgi:molecular chaperone DnaK